MATDRGTLTCRLRQAVAAIIAIGLSCIAQADDTVGNDAAVPVPAAVNLWQQMLRQDLVFARTTLNSRYIHALTPGGETWDKQLAAAVRQAEMDTKLVSDFGGYLAVLRRFAGAFEDAHVRVRFNFQPVRYDWPAFLVRYQSGKYVVAQSGTSAIAKGALAWISAIYANLMFWITAALLFPVCLFYFLWNYDHIIEFVRDHLPEDTRDIVVKIVCTIDRSMAEFFRGRLIICAAVGALTALGWVACPGVANGLPFGILVGVLNLVPFLAFLGLPPVLILTYVERTGADEDWIMPIVLALAVFLAVQAIENFALSPYVMAQSSGLHPVTAVIVLLIGGQIAGVLGMLLAVPIASTLKTLGAEFVMPEVRRLAGIDEKPLFEGPLALKDAEPHPSAETDSSSDA